MDPISIIITWWGNTDPVLRVLYFGFGIAAVLIFALRRDGKAA